MAPFVTEVPGCTCPRCIAFATPIVPTTGGGALVPAVAPVPAGPPAAAPHEFWDRATPPPIEGFVEGRFVTEAPRAADPPPPVTFPIVPTVEPPREVQIVRVGTPLADVIGLPGNPFLT